MVMQLLGSSDQRIGHGGLGIPWAFDGYLILNVDLRLAHVLPGHGSPAMPVPGLAGASQLSRYGYPRSGLV